VTLAWNSSASANVAGYMIHYGNDCTNYTNQMDAGTNTTCTVTGLQAGQTYYFVVSAYDSSNDESPPSNQAVFHVPELLQVSITNSSPPAVVINFPVSTGGVYALQVSADLLNWMTIWQTNTTSNGWVQFQGPITRFYRTASN